MTIADELDKAMADYRPGGINQPELEEMSGVPQATISRTLKGKSIPETKTLIKLAAALKCTLGGYTGTSTPLPETYRDQKNVLDLGVREPVLLPEPLNEIITLAKAMTRDGQFVLLGRAQEIAIKYQVKQTASSSSSQN